MSFSNKETVKFQLKSFRGATGPVGPQGERGIQGQKGDKGKAPTLGVQEIEGGHRINIRDGETGFLVQSFDVMDGKDGTSGINGTDGYSPTVDVQETADGYMIVITSKKPGSDAIYQHKVRIQNGEDYVLTEEDKQEIAGMVNVEGGSSEFKYLGLNPLTSSAEDTTTYWSGLGAGYARFTTSLMNGQPSQYGMLLNWVRDGIVWQEFNASPSGPTYNRSGNADGWSAGGWRRVYDTANPPPSSGSYTLPVATSDTLGGVMPTEKTDDMTQAVGVDALGGLWTAPGEGGGEKSWSLIGSVVTEEEVQVIKIDVPETYTEFFFVAEGMTVETSTFHAVKVNDDYATNAKSVAECGSFFYTNNSKKWCAYWRRLVGANAHYTIKNDNSNTGQSSLGVSNKISNTDNITIDYIAFICYQALQVGFAFTAYGR